MVLVGDAAGHNDPLIGQGLSITQADVRNITDALLSTDDWSAPGVFDEYGREQAERLRRLRIAAGCTPWRLLGTTGPGSLPSVPRSARSPRCRWCWPP